MATITKQRVFNKAMINRFTEVIFIDEACPSTLDIDDWKILTQGGHTACDVKYKTAKSFINRCPMLLTAQKKLEFRPEDQPAMGRRLRREEEKIEKLHLYKFAQAKEKSRIVASQAPH